MNDFLSLPNEHMDVYVTISKQGAYYQASFEGRDKSDGRNRSELLSSASPLSRMLLEQLLDSFGFNQIEVVDALAIEEGESTTIRHPLW